ncbi:glycerol kinase [Deinococcus carri]|uniref:Glycerol kinase n=1 Tax=Deinococcus carri TaxID=1211323 RepID=A0ABP9WBR4_9DEIO
MDPHLVGLDFGTTALKAVLFQGAREVHRLNFPYPLNHDLPGQASHRLPQLLDAYERALDELEAYCAAQGIQPAAVGFSNVMHSLITVSAEGPSEVYTWADARADTGGHPPSFLFDHTGVPYHPMTPAVKLAWLTRTQDARAWQRVSGLKEEVLLRSFGVFWTDTSTAAATGLMNIDGHYDPEALRVAGVEAAQLPEIKPIDQPLPPLLQPYRSRYPRLAAAHWVIGASDGVTATEGLNIQSARQAAVSVGTSSAIRTFSRGSALDPEARLFCYRVDDREPGGRYLVGGPSNNAGLVLNWLREHFQLPLTLEDLMTGTVPGARGLLFLPALAGERAPFWDPQLQGAMLGLGLHHTPGDIARAGMEGVALHLAWLADLLRAQVGPLDEIRVTGGLTRSPAWLQVLANALNQPVSLPQDAELFEGSAFGAARIAARGAGLSLEAERAYTQIHPNADQPLYARLGRQYRAAALALRDLTHTLHAGTLAE